MCSMAENISKNDIYRPSASVIIAAKTQTPEDDGYDYNVLLIKRSPKTAYAPEHCVFPGGALDVFDESIEWLHYFKEFGITELEIRALIPTTINRPHILASQGTGCYDRFFKKSKIWARDISLRITALRETFEEVGILFCRQQQQQNQHLMDFGNAKDDFDREYWQKLVHNDASQFLILCKKLNVVPDLWCLQEWSVWRSSASANKKFETVFYFVSIQRIPNLLLESNEVALAMWHSPPTLLRIFDERHIWLAYIIFYELARLTNIRNWLELYKFAYQRCRSHGTTLLQAAMYHLKDGVVGILTGDDACPKDPSDLKGTVPVNKTILEFSKNIKNFHRIILRDMHVLYIDINVSVDGHLKPNRNSSNTSKL